MDTSKLVSSALDFAVSCEVMLHIYSLFHRFALTSSTYKFGILNWTPETTG